MTHDSSQVAERTTVKVKGRADKRSVTHAKPDGTPPIKKHRSALTCPQTGRRGKPPRPPGERRWH